MTTTERLIRNLCKGRGVETFADQKADTLRVRDSVPWKELPVPVRRAIVEHRAAAKMQTRIEKLIKRCGFHAYSHLLHPGHALSRSMARVEKNAIERRGEERREAIDRLQTRAIVDSLGKSPSDAKAVLDKLQRDLAKV